MTDQNFTATILNLASGGRLRADDELHLEMVIPVEQPNGVTIDRLFSGGWLERMPNGGTYKISDKGMKAYLRSTDESQGAGLIDPESRTS